MAKRKEEREGSLLARVRALLEESAVTALEIYASTGIAPNQQWAIKSGATKDPSVNTIECLYDYLNGEPLARAIETQKIKA